MKTYNKMNSCHIEEVVSLLLSKGEVHKASPLVMLDYILPIEQDERNNKKEGDDSVSYNWNKVTNFSSLAKFTK